MQTFMTHEDYTETAKTLDNKRLGKQRVEAYQILRALLGESNGWIHHPATRMWQGFEYELALYGLTISMEFYERGFDGWYMAEVFSDYQQRLSERNTEKYPWWTQEHEFRISHQSNLLRKDAEFYGDKFVGIPNNYPYLWPLDNYDFKLGTFKKGDNLDMALNVNAYLTSKQIAELLGVSPKTISAYKARGQMPAPDKEYGRTPLWKFSTIQQWRSDVRVPVTGQFK